jgi:hypothetical protein
MNNAASSLAKLGVAKRRKRLGKKGMSEAMRALANKRHGNLTK